MDTRLLQLHDRVSELGTHFRKYLNIIDSSYERLVDRLEAAEIHDQVQLWAISKKPEVEFHLVSSAGTSERESLDFMACYYALQYLQITVFSLEMLELDIAEAQEPIIGWRHLLEFHEKRALPLHGAYLGALLDWHRGGQQDFPEYVVCVVGTRWDQDDIDLCVVHEGEAGLDCFRRALAKSITEMFRHAISPHMYISEQLGMSGYSATLPEYMDTLARRLQDYVMISELLSAAPLTGSRHLFDRFKARSMDCYYQNSGPSLRYHEGFLRGLLGDLQSLLVRDFHGGRINFKEDALRLSKGLLLACKVMGNIRESDIFQATGILKQANPLRAADYESILDAAVLVETMRFLYQVYSVQEESISLDGSQEAVLNTVGRSMGFFETGGVKPAQQLLVHYYTSVHQIREIAQRQFVELTSYLKNVSVFTRGMTSGEAGEQAGGRHNLAVELAETIRLFGGQVFWDDVLGEMRGDGFRFTRRIISDLMALPEEKRRETLCLYADFGTSEPGTLLNFLLVLHEEGSPEGLKIYRELVDLYFGQTASGSDFSEKICRLFKTRPRVLNRFVETLDPGRRAWLETLLDGKPSDSDSADTLMQIRQYILLRTRGSEFYRRVFRRVMAKYPRFILYVSDVKMLHRLSEGLYTRALNIDDFDFARQALADYYDVQYLACAVRAMMGEEPLEYRSRFIQFADNYLRSLYHICLDEELHRLGSARPARDLFGVFAAGGYGREQAFDDDYDLLLVLNSDDPAEYELARRTWARVHKFIVKRGTLPQYRFADHFGEFVTRASDLQRFLAERSADVVDKAQLLGIRQVIGSSRLLRQLRETAIRPMVMSAPEEFVAAVSRDIRDRRGFSYVCEGCIDIKEAPGGMRDIEQTLLVLNARLGILEPVTYRLFDIQSMQEPGLTEPLQRMRENHHLLREVRDLYRILVAASDEIQLEWLEPVARVMALHRPGMAADPEALFRTIAESMEEVRRVVDALLPAGNA